MKLDGMPIGAVDWREVDAVGHAGETGSATARPRSGSGAPAGPVSAPISS